MRLIVVSSLVLIACGASAPVQTQDDAGLAQDAAAEGGDLGVQRQPCHVSADAEQGGFIGQQGVGFGGFGQRLIGGADGAGEMTMQGIRQRGESALRPCRAEQHHARGHGEGGSDQDTP